MSAEILVFDDQSWREDAACVPATKETPVLAATWTDEKHFMRPTAEAICKECPVRMSCIADALSDDEAEGIRGGYYFSKGRVPFTEARKMQREIGIKTAKTRQKTRKALAEAARQDAEDDE